MKVNSSMMKAESDSHKKIPNILISNYDSQCSHQHKRLSRRCRYNRLIEKSGRKNFVDIKYRPFLRIRLLNDAFHTMIHLKWRWIVFACVLVHFLIWFIFAVLWYIAAMSHDDFDANPPVRLCVTGGKDFINIFLASVEAQTTIGFGDRAIDEECPESIFLLIAQLVMGTGISGVLVSIVYAKITRPEKTARNGVGFSSNALINVRNGVKYMEVRVWDLDYDHIIGSEIQAYYIQTIRTREGEVLSHYIREIKLLNDKIHLLWPVVLVHIIDERSPLYGITRDNINEDFEISFCLKGASQVLGTYTQSLTSYIRKEIKWNYTFQNVLWYDKELSMFVVDTDNLNTLVKIE